MEWYKKCWQKYADFTGRARRKEYWMFYALTMVFFVVALTVDSLISVATSSLFDFSFPIVFLLLMLASIVPTLAVTVRRLHDTNRSGWYYFISLIPLVGGIILFVALVEDGTSGTNKYGEDPKELIFKEKQLLHEQKVKQRKLEMASVLVEEESAPRVDNEDHSRFMPRQNQ